MSNIDYENFIYLLKTNTQEEFLELIKRPDIKLFEGLAYYLKDENKNNIIDHIKLDVKYDKYNILDNLLLLQPLSLPIIESFIDSNFFNTQDFIKKIDMVYKISSTILDTLTEYKKQIRKEYKTDIGSSKEELENVLKEIKKYEKELKILKQKQKEDTKLVKLKKELESLQKELNSNNIEQLQEQIEHLKSKKKELETIKKELNSSEKLFKNLPKDEA